MQFILTFTLPAATRDAAMARFLETGGQPPPGVTLLGRWTQLDLCGGVVLLESEDPKALTAFAHAWSDVVELTMVPVLEDQALSDVLRHARTARRLPMTESLVGQGIGSDQAVAAPEDVTGRPAPDIPNTKSG
jgi:hypothetical protein